MVTISRFLYPKSLPQLFMFNKLKSRKAPLSLSSVSNAIKSSSSSSLTPQLESKHLKVTSGDQLGLPMGSIDAIAFDPVQSLLAVGTKAKTVHVYGQQTVEVVFELNTRAEIAHLRFLKGIYLVCVETSGTITILSLHSKSILSTYSAPGTITAVESDPSMDWLIFGLANGSLFFYDVDRFNLTPFRVDNLQKVVLPKQKLSPVRSIQWHPRDIGTLLITYSHCAIQFSISGGGIKNSFTYISEPGTRGYAHSNGFATGNKKKLFGSPKPVVCEMNEAHYHPNGLHIVTVHADGSLVFWDANDGKLLEARTVKETGLHKPGDAVQIEENVGIKAKWIAAQDPEITSLLITGSSATSSDTVDILDFGYTLKYSLTSHEKQGAFYANPQEGRRVIKIDFYQRNRPEGTREVIKDILPVAAEAQPYFNGCHNPSSVFFISSLGSLYYSNYTNGRLQTSSLPPSLSSIVPPITFSDAQLVKRVEWFGLLPSKRTGYKGMLTGGASVNKGYPRTLGADENLHNIYITGHEDGSVNLFDMTSGEFHDDEAHVQISLKEVLDVEGRFSSYCIVSISCSFESRELLVGVGNGNVALCKFMKPNSNPITSIPSDYETCPVLHENGDAKIRDISKRLPNSSHSSFAPFALLVLGEEDYITSMKMSNAGFGAIGYKSGKLVVMDVTRGPAVILNSNIRQHLPSVTGECFVTAIEFAIMEYGQDGFSSLIMIVGTNAGGNLLLFKIIPQPNGGFQVAFADKTLGLNYKNADPDKPSGLDQLMPINASTGESTIATLDMFRKLGKGSAIPGYIVVGSSRDLRVLKTPKQKLAHKVVDETCLCNGVVQLRDRGAVLVSVTESGFLKLFSLPSLSETDVKIPNEIFSRLKKSRMSSLSSGSTVLGTGEILIQLSRTEVMSLLLYDDSRNKPQKTKPTDSLFNENAIIPPRPTAGAMSWAKGQITLTSTSDLTSLIAGPNRRQPKHPESQLAYNISPEANPNQTYGAYNGVSSTPKPAELYAQPTRRATATNPYAFGTQGFMRSIRDGIDSVEENVNSYASGLSEAMTETVEGQKKSLYSSALKSKFGF
ncbi:putative Rab GTPase-binding protein [Clavispora lusitaniae]|uniref:Rab GTPase-binding protein n=1 Tax=Clavispora lusitaniae TaxID=36911 RepID=A0AA91Q1X7_CLALS|nr:putative Rab GTPase-binding protein [Clavispora lusitaniae]